MFIGVQVKTLNALRIGKKCENVDKPHLLKKVTAKSSYKEAQISRNCIKLCCNKDNPEVIQSIYVSPNLAAQEQDASQTLSDELKQHKGILE